ncbi:MAG: Crp/Fnr family transcriptional regulator [Burkholderiaceae bacterium]
MGYGADSAAAKRLLALSEFGQVRTYKKGTIMIAEGDHGASLFILQTGAVRAYSDNSIGREITFGVYGPGDYVGEMSLDGGSRSASIIAIEQTRCSVVSRDTVVKFVSECPEFAFDLLARVIRRGRLATQSARNLALMDSYSRLVLALSELATPGNGSDKGVIPRVTHRELANQIGTSREMVSRLLKDLEKGGYISTEGRRISIQRKLPAGW